MVLPVQYEHGNDCATDDGADGLRDLQPLFAEHDADGRLDQDERWSWIWNAQAIDWRLPILESSVLIIP